MTLPDPRRDLAVTVLFARAAVRLVGESLPTRLTPVASGTDNGRSCVDRGSPLSPR